MRNLKRALSLTLASVMLLGMMVIGTSAASFNDADEISNVTAATVLQELKVMQGTGGNFAPDETVTRGQMAILICKILYGDKLNVSQFSGTTQFNDVPANAYYTGYVNLASSLGIISGYGDGNFGPGDPVTTAQAALMLTRALGWFQGGELKGQNWGSNALAAVSQATKLEMFGDLRLEINDGLSRDNVAEMVFNTMTKAVPVQYSERWDTYYTDQASVMSGVKFDYKNTLGYTNYSLLYTEANEKDAFGRPSITWGTGVVTKTDPDGKLDTTLTGDSKAVVTMRDEIITTPKAADAVYAGKVTSKTLWDDLGLRETVASSNTVSAGRIDVYTDSDSAVSTATIVKNDTSDPGKFGADGQTVEAYYTKGASASDDKVILVITSTYLGVVVDESYRQDNKDGMRVDVLGKGLKFIEATGYKEDDLLLVNVSGNDLKAIVGVPDTVTGEATRVGINSERHRSLTIDGKKYSQSTLFSTGDNKVIKGESNASLDIEKTYTLYLDQNDCFLAAVKVEDNSQTDLVYVTRVYKGSTLDGDEVKAKAMATVVYMDGTYKTVALTKYNGSEIDPDTLTGPLGAVGKLTELVYDEDDKEYELKEANAGDWKSTSISIDSKVELKTDTRYATLNTGAGNVYLNSDTVYVFVSYKNGDPDDGIDDVKVVTGGVSFDIANTMSGAYAKRADERTAGYVVIAAEYEAANKDIVYIKDDAKQNTKDGRLYNGYYADSTAKELVPVDKTTTGYPTLSAGFYEYSERSNGNLKLTAVASEPLADNQGAFLNKAITSMQQDSQGYLMTITDGNTTYDLNGVNVVDMTDKDKASENTYGSNITDLGSLYRAVDMKNGANPRYTVSVSIYVNKDNEVTNLVINSIQDWTAGPDPVTVTPDVGSDLSGANITVTFDSGSSADVNEGDTIDVVIHDNSYVAPSRTVGDPKTSFTNGEYYTVTINGTDYENILCETDHELVVTYTVKAADLTGQSPKITVESIVEGEEPDPEEPGTHSHVWSAWALDAESGKHVRTCSGTGDCTATTEDLEHTASIDNTSWSKDENKHWHACSVQGCTVKESETDHTWDNGTEKTPANCTDNQVKTYTCTENGCGQTKEEEVADSATGHTLSSATDNSDGTHTGTCSECNKSVAESCTYESGTCSVCGGTQQ